MHAPAFALVSILLAVMAAPPASAQMTGPMGGGTMPGMMGGEMMERPMGRMMPGGRGDHERPHEGPLVTIILEHSQELGLSPEQEKKLRDLRTAFAKDAIRRGAEIRVAEIDLDSLLEQNVWDMPKIETQAKQIASLEGELRLARIRTIQAGRALLSPEQLDKLRHVGHRMGMSAGGGSMQHGMGGRPGMPRPGDPGPGQHSH